MPVAVVHVLEVIQVECQHQPERGNVLRSGASAGATCVLAIVVASE